MFVDSGFIIIDEFTSTELEEGNIDISREGVMAGYI